MTAMSLQQIAVPFHNSELYIVEYNGQPYTPMKPIVEGMGLDWAAQFNKLKQKFASTIAEITIVANDGKERLMTCLPIRKLAAWLYSISPNKVKPELRDTIIMYQNECDDVLWDYWTKGQAINQRHTIGVEQQRILHDIVDSRANGNRKIYAEMWSRHNRHFKIPRYSELLVIHFDDAVKYLEEMQLKGVVEPQNSQSAFDLLAAETTSKVMDYYWSLHAEIKRLGGKAPEYPEFDEETIVRASVTRMVDKSRMLLTFDARTGKPQVSFIPNDSWILTSENIAGIIADPQGVEKKLLPDIVQAAVGRLAK